jgi:hypothetical protein
VKWAGNGIVSSLAGDGTNGNITTLGVIVNDRAYANAGSGVLYTTFSGQSVGINDVLVKYTYFGDADLDGKVGTNDYFQIDSGFLNGRSGWINGDFDYDGRVSTNDYFLIDNSFLSHGLPLSPAAFEPGAALAGVTGVPEPASAAALAAVGAALLRRRTRRR